MSNAGQILQDVLQWPLIVKREVQQQNYKTLGVSAVAAYAAIGNPFQPNLVPQDYLYMYLIIGGITVGVRFLIDGSA